MARWRIDRHVALQLNVQNLFDQQYYSKSFYWYALPAPGRSIMATLDLKL
jgi:catecholate siderophore receptor